MKRFLPGVTMLLCLAASTAGAQRDSTASQITASGRGEVQMKPTKAFVSFTIQAKSATAAVAASENARLVAQTMRSLLSAGLTQDNISNAAYSVGLNYEMTSTGGKQEGFIATHVLRVEITNTANVGKIIDAGLAGGATQVSSAQYVGDNMDAARQDALKSAVAEARRDAETMAAAAGGTLGRLVNLTSGGSFPPVPRDVYYEMSVATRSSAPTMIRPNDVTVMASVTGRWEFIPRR